MKFIYIKKKKGFPFFSKVFLFHSKLSHLIPEILLAALRVILDIRLRIQLSRVQGGCICARRVQECVRGGLCPRVIHRPNHDFEIQLRSSFPYSLFEFSTLEHRSRRR